MNHRMTRAMEAFVGRHGVMDLILVGRHHLTLPAIAALIN